MSKSATATKPPAPAKLADVKQQSGKMHRRSRTGCFTCRLRRKKCDEGKPCCRACRKLGISCEYKRPMWWSNSEHRKMQKDQIKDIIKTTKLQEKSAMAHAHAHAIPLTTNTPPSLYHSPSDGMCRTRGGSMDSAFSAEFDFNTIPTTDMYCPMPLGQPMLPGYSSFPAFTPFDIDIKTETQFFVNDIETHRDSTITSSCFQQVPVSSPGQSSVENWVQKDYFETRQEAFVPVDEMGEIPFLDFHSSASVTPPQPAPTPENNEEYLINYFRETVLPLAFPARLNPSSSSPADIVLKAAETNKAYRHSCLCVAAIHLKTAQGIQNDKLEEDISNHMVVTIGQICDTLKSDSDLEKVLEAALSMIYLRCLVGGADDGVSEVAWASHFGIVADVVKKLDLHTPVPKVEGEPLPPIPLNMTIAAWIDILGATMQGRRPEWANQYRERMIREESMGFTDLMGCDDTVMMLISEIACMEAAKAEGTYQDHINLCLHISSLGQAITSSETRTPRLANAISTTGALDTKQLHANITALFRIAARIYLCTLLADFDRHHANIQGLVSQFEHTMDYIPAGPDGFDRAIVWPLLMAGSVSLPGSPFRSKLAERVAQMSAGMAVSSPRSDVSTISSPASSAFAANACGSFARVQVLLDEVWQVNDAAVVRGEPMAILHWRDVMRQRGWDFLLI